jgi:precorrin-3B methylase
MAEKDREVISTFLSQIKNAVEDLKISLSNLELILDVNFKKLQVQLQNNIQTYIYNSLNSYFESELPKVIYVVEKVITKKQMELLKQSLEKELSSLFEEIKSLKEKEELINKKLNALAVIEAKNPEDKLKIYLLTTDKKEIKKKELEKIFGKDIVKKVLKELEGKIEVKIT